MIECKVCLLDENVPDIHFNNDGKCNYCDLHENLAIVFPQGSQGEDELNRLIDMIKAEGKNKKYDVVVGVSGGVDSSYLLHMTKVWKLRALAVHVDNGWNSEISVKNMRSVLQKLSIDLRTHVIEWTKMREILKAFLRASFSWADAPTDIAIQRMLYKVAAEEDVKYLLIGADFRSEGRQPTAWTHCDGKMLKYITKKFGVSSLKGFPNLTFSNLFYYTIVKKIKRVTPFYYMKYDKNVAKQELAEMYGWQDYGGHHHESIFTRFVVSNWLVNKFNVDKRVITYSAWIRSGYISKTDAKQLLAKPACSDVVIKEDIQYIKKKLGLSNEEFEKIWTSEKKWPVDFPSYLAFYDRILPIVKATSRFLFPTKPMLLFELKNENHQKK